MLTVLLVLLGARLARPGVRASERDRRDLDLNTYNFLFLMLGLLLHWRPKRFLVAVAKSVPATAGVLIQFPFYGAIARCSPRRRTAGADGLRPIAHAFVAMTTHDSFPLVMGVYSAVLGFFVPSGGGKWLLEAPYVMQAANELQGASRLGGADLQRRRGAAEPDQPVLDAAAARHPRPARARHRRLHLPAARWCTCRWCCSCSGSWPRP